jgi:hypothetical protein
VLARHGSHWHDLVPAIVSLALIDDLELRIAGLTCW